MDCALLRREAEKSGQVTAVGPLFPRVLAGLGMSRYQCLIMNIHAFVSPRADTLLTDGANLDTIKYSIQDERT